MYYRRYFQKTDDRVRLATQVLTGCSDRTIRLFNPSRGSGGNALIQKYEAHGYEVLDIAVADDNARFASVGGDKTVFVWDVASATTIRRLSGHSGRCNAVAFAADGGVLVSGESCPSDVGERMRHRNCGLINGLCRELRCDGQAVGS